MKAPLIQNGLNLCYINHSNLDFSVIFQAPKRYRSRIKIMSFPICIHENTGTIFEPEKKKLIKHKLNKLQENREKLIYI